MEDIDNQAGYWDRVAWEKTFSIPLDLPKFSSLVGKDRRILDYGCGYGRICGQLWNAGFRNVVGVDSSRKMIERARSECPHIGFEVLEASALPYNDGSFDAALLFAVLTCIPIDDRQRAVIGEITRVLRPGGILYISDYLLQDDDRNVQRYRESQKRFGRYGIFQHPEGALMRHHDPAWIRELTSDYELIEMSEIDIVTMNGNPARAFRYLGEKRQRSGER